MSSTSKGDVCDMLNAITIRNQKMSPLLRLPAEIRNQIYSYVFSDTRIEICWQWACKSPGVAAPKQHVHYPAKLLRLLEVCKQTFAEIRLLVFSLGCLSGDWIDMRGFLSRALIKIDQKCAVKKVNFSIYHDGLPAALEINIMPKSPASHSFEFFLQGLRKLQGLEKVVVTLYRYDWEVLVEDQVMIRDKVRQVFQEQGFNVKIEFDVMVKEFGKDWR